MYELAVMYALVVLGFLGLCLIARQRAVAALRDGNPVLYRAALSDLAPVRVPSTRHIHGWLSRRRDEDELRRNRALRNWIRAHDAAVSGIVIMLGAYLLVWLKY